VTGFQVTRFVTLRLSSTRAAPCSSVWQNGDAGLTICPELNADRACSTFVADGRLEAVDAARAGIGGDDMLLQPPELGSVLGAQSAPLSGGVGFAAERAQLDAIRAFRSTGGVGRHLRAGGS
jgi:hypothetical protein